MVHLKHLSPNEFYMYRLIDCSVAYWDVVPSKMSDFHKIPFLTVKSSIVSHLQYTSNPTETGGRGQKLWHLYQRDWKTPITPPRSRGWLHLVFLHALSKERRSRTLNPKDFVKCMDFDILESIIVLTKKVFYPSFINETPPLLFSSWIKHNAKSTHLV